MKSMTAVIICGKPVIQVLIEILASCWIITVDAAFLNLAFKANQPCSLYAASVGFFFNWNQFHGIVFLTFEPLNAVGRLKTSNSCIEKCFDS